MRVLRVLGCSFRDTYSELFLIIGLSLLWWLATITVVASAPATAALASIGYRLAQEQRVNLDFAREAFRQHFWLSWRVGIINLVSGFLIAFNLVFYSRTQGWSQLLVFLFLYLAIAWLSVQLYAYPLISAMEEPSMKLVLRNAALITFANPVFSLLLVIALSLVTVLALVVPVLALLLLPGFAAILGGRALADRLELAGERQRPN